MGLGPTNILGLLASVATLAVAVGGLAWAVGRDAFGKRAVVFGVVLAAVAPVLAVQAAAVVVWLRVHQDMLLWGVAFAICAVALARMVLAGGARQKEQGKLARKKRVGRAP